MEQGADFQQILSSPTEAYAEGLRFFMGKSLLNNALRSVASDLEAHGIDYIVIGAIALNQHGYRRFTEDIDLLLTKEGLEKFREELIGLAYRPTYEGSTKTFGTTAENVPIEIMMASEYPGDGLPKPVKFPDPGENFVVIDGIKTVTLEKLIELKLASGMTAPDRLKDLADVQELIKTKSLDSSFAAKLDPSCKISLLNCRRRFSKPGSDKLAGIVVRQSKDCTTAEEARATQRGRARELALFLNYCTRSAFQVSNAGVRVKTRNNEAHSQPREYH
jgi:predicted nucleotidyltransferase